MNSIDKNNDLLGPAKANPPATHELALIIPKTLGCRIEANPVPCYKVKPKFCVLLCGATIQIG
jgi:hypothetical protein